MTAVDEARVPLVAPNSSETIQLLGKTCTRDEEGWHFIITFPIHDAATTAKLKAAKLPSNWLKEWAEPCFPGGDEGSLGSWPTAKKKFDALAAKGAEATEYDFHVAARTIVSEILCGEIGGFDLETMKSIDGDELFLKIKLADEEIIKACADRMDIPMKIDVQWYAKMRPKSSELRSFDPEFEHTHNDPAMKKAYPNGGHYCPTIAMSGGKFTGDQLCPAFTAYTTRKDEKGYFNKMESGTITEIAQRRISELIVADELMSREVICSFFPVHHWNRILQLEQEGFQSFTKPLSRKGESTLNDYLGPELAYFSHWFNFYTYNLAPMAVAAVGIRICRQFNVVDVSAYHDIACIYAILIILWSAIFSARYERAAEECHERWGTKLRMGVQKVRCRFNVAKRGSTAESLQNAFHWLLVLILIGYTGYVTGYISTMRADMAKDENSTLFGLEMISHKLSMKISKILVTVNIKVVAFLWGVLSPWLTKRENHRTDVEEKNARVVKLFIVKAVVYYYPFFYIAFAQKHIEGCEGPCISLLQENLAIFFVTQLATTFGMILATIAYTRYQIWTEYRKMKAKKQNRPYSYLQLQNKCPDFTEDTDDLMEIVISLGFLVMFSVALPAMVCIAFMANFLQVKLLAYRAVYVQRRPMQVVQVGIGVWTVIIRILAVIGVITNSAVAAFVFDDTWLEEYNMFHRLVLFIFMQNLIIAARVVIELFITPVPPAVVRAREINAIVLDELMGDVVVPLPNNPKNMPALELKEVDKWAGSP